MRDQRGTMIELYLVPAVGLVLLALAGGQWQQGHRIAAGILAAAGLGLIIWIAAFVIKGWWDSRR